MPITALASSYNWNEQLYVRVMAKEVEKIMPGTSCRLLYDSVEIVKV